MFCPLTATISHSVRPWPLFRRRGNEPRREQKTLAFDLCPSPGLDTWELKKKRYSFLSFNHVEVEVVILGGLKDTYLYKIHFYLWSLTHPAASNRVNPASMWCEGCWV